MLRSIPEVKKVLSLAEIDEEGGVSYWRLADVRTNHEAAGMSYSLNVRPRM